jgi:hypothetical protein
MNPMITIKRIIAVIGIKAMLVSGNNMMSIQRFFDERKFKKMMRRMDHSSLICLSNYLLGDDTALSRMSKKDLARSGHFPKPSRETNYIINWVAKITMGYKVGSTIKKLSDVQSKNQYANTRTIVSVMADGRFQLNSYINIRGSERSAASAEDLVDMEWVVVNE